MHLMLAIKLSKPWLFVTGCFVLLFVTMYFLIFISGAHLDFQNRITYTSNSKETSMESTVLVHVDQPDPISIISCDSINRTLDYYNISKETLSWTELNNQPWASDIMSGYWRPINCKTNRSLAIIIPFRDRDEHLRKLLNHLHPFLQRQMSRYQIFLIEQASTGMFNKGALTNAGFKIIKEAFNESFSCFIFHDVDMLPLKDENLYKCLDHPLHLGAAMDKFNYKLVYDNFLGGVLAMTSDQFVRVNGYSNLYEGWGGEDDDMAERIVAENYRIRRYPIQVSQYKMIKHTADIGNPKNPDRLKLLVNARKRYKHDGLNQIFYKSIKVDSKSGLVYWINVKLPKKNYFMKMTPL